MVEIKLAPRHVALGLFAGFAVLLACYVTIAISRVQSGNPDPWFAPLLDFDREGNIPSWYNAILFVIAAWASWINSKYAAALDPRQARHWFVISIVLIVLSVDELAALHELLSAFKSLQTAVNFGWIVILGPLAALLGLWFIPFLLRVPRTISVYLLAAGIVYLTGAVALEVVGGQIVEGIVHVPRSEMSPEQWAQIARNRTYLLEVAFEESCEQCGLILYIYASLSYLSQAGAVLHATFASQTR